MIIKMPLEIIPTAFFVMRIAVNMLAKYMKKTMHRAMHGLEFT